MRGKFQFTCCVVVALAGCAGGAARPQPAANNPASAAAPEAPRPAAFVGLAPDEFDRADSATATGRGARPGVYVCPMHPEVTQVMPGTCPKCGMKLILKKEDE